MLLSQLVLMAQRQSPPPPRSLWSAGSPKVSPWPHQLWWGKTPPPLWNPEACCQTVWPSHCLSQPSPLDRVVVVWIKWDGEGTTCPCHAPRRKAEVRAQVGCSLFAPNVTHPLHCLFRARASLRDCVPLSLRRGPLLQPRPLPERASSHFLARLPVCVHQHCEQGTRALDPCQAGPTVAAGTTSPG